MAPKPKAGPIIGAIAGVALLVGAIVLGPVEDILTGGIGIVDDPIALALGVGGVGLLIWGVSQAVGKDG